MRLEYHSVHFRETPATNSDYAEGWLSHRFHAKTRKKEDSVDKFQRADEAAALIVDTAVKLHIEVGPGLLETVYETVLAGRLAKRGLSIERQKRVTIEIDGIQFTEGFRIDLLVDGSVIVEVKSVESLLPVHSKQLLTYLRLTNLSVGLLINFGAPTLRTGIKRIVNGFASFSHSRLRVNQPSRYEDVVGE